MFTHTRHTINRPPVTMAFLGLLALVLTIPPALLAQPGTNAPDDLSPEQIRAEIESSSEAAIEAFKEGDLDAAGEHLAQLVDLQPDSFIHRYNLACVRSRQGRDESAAELLVQAVEYGFSDIHLLRNDPSLANARETQTVANLIDNWTEILDRRVDADLDRAREIYGSNYWYVKDPELRLAYVCAFDQTTLEQVRQEVRDIHAWAMAHVFSQTDNEDNLVSPDDPWVLVVLPTREDFRGWAVREFGAAARNHTQAIGGQYSHDDKQLVTMDLGATLRHEFMHVLHWRSNARRGQIHPVWVQEGLCSLIEDYDLAPNGELVPTESWRTNQAQFLAETGHLLHLKHLAKVTRHQFANTRPLAQYAQSRAFFLFLYREGRLADWYAHFTDHFRDDPSGMQSVVATLGSGRDDQASVQRDIEEIHKRYAEFCRALPEIPEEIKRGMASIGVTIDADGVGEGIRIAGTVRRGTAGDLRLNDVITHIEGRAVRDYWELVRVLTSYRPGETVTVNYRRARLHRETEVTLRASK